MASLELLKNKIKSIDTTKKITNAMKLVATANLKKQREKFAESNEYIEGFYDIYRLVSNEIQDINHETHKNTYWVVVTSSLGLCGSYNNFVIKKLIANIKEGDKVILIGKKGYSYMKSKGFEKNIKMFININPKDIQPDVISYITNYLLDKISEEKHNIKIIYTKFINAIKFVPDIFDVFPILPIDQSENSLSNKSINFSEQDPKELLDSMTKQFIQVAIQGSILESNISENASRRNSMDTATENAEDLKQEYLNLYNTTRQSKITQEIIEIIGGSNE